MKAQIKLKQSGGADMYEKEMIIKNKTGLHARPATDLSTLCQTYESDIKIRTNDTEIDSKSIISILSGGICKGTKIKLIINGTDEKEAGEKISEFIENLKE
jgi:phosphocarrier protein HPr